MPDYGVGTNPQNDILLNGAKVEYNLVTTGEITAATFTNIGYTSKDAGGVLTDKQPTFKEVKVTGLDDPVKRKPTDKEVTAKFTILQMNLQNFSLAVGGLPTDVVTGATSVYKGGKSQDSNTIKWRFTIINDDDTTKDKQIYIMKGKVVDATEFKFGDNDETAVQVTVRAQVVTGAESPAIVDGGVALTNYRYVVKEGNF